jgi:hypothetical protein
LGSNELGFDAAWDTVLSAHRGNPHWAVLSAPRFQHNVLVSLALPFARIKSKKKKKKNSGCPLTSFVRVSDLVV